MATQYSTTQRTAQMSSLNSGIGISAVIKIFSGPVPANCATADTGTLLVTFAGNATGFGSAANAVLTAASVANATASGTGTAGYYRIYPTAASTTNAITQGTCGTAGTDMILTNTSIAAGQTCTFNSFTVTAFGV